MASITHSIGNRMNIIQNNPILAIIQDADYLDNSARQAQVREYENPIDPMVYALFGPTEEENMMVAGEQ